MGGIFIPAFVQTEAAKGIPHASLKSIFTTPLYVANLVSAGKVNTTFNEKLTSVATKAYDAFSNSEVSVIGHCPTALSRTLLCGGAPGSTL